MRIRSIILAIVVSALSWSPCVLSAQEADSANVANVANDTTYLPMATGYDWITYRGKLDVTDPGGTHSCNFFMVNRIDSILYLNLHAMGVEVIRVVLTPDSITYVNKLTYQFYQGTYEPFRKFFPFPVDFQLVQAMVNGETEKLPHGQGLSFEYSNFEPVDSTSSFFTEFTFKELNRLVEVQGKIKMIRLNVPGVTRIKIPESFERIEP